LMDYLSSHVVLRDNHTLGVKFIVEILKSVGHRIIDDPEQLASQARAHFQGFNDPVLECLLFRVISLA
jgi:hypothetical protein